MGKVKFGAGSKQETVKTVEVIRELQPVLPVDKKVRKHVRHLRKKLKMDLEALSKMQADLLAREAARKLQIEELHSKIESLESQLVKAETSLSNLPKPVVPEKVDLKPLNDELVMLSGQIDLIKSEMKVKPVHIKREKVTETFDHRLLVFNIVLVFINIILLWK